MNITRISLRVGLLPAVFAALLATSAHAQLQAQAPVTTPLAGKVRSEVDRVYPELESLYRHFHAHPELSLHEEQTAAKFADALEAAGAKVTRNFGGFGVVGVLANGDGPKILVRTDLDALPVVEQTGAAYASTVKTTNDKGESVGVMHACGHDMHMASLIGVARVLATLKDSWHGTVIFIGQPAEERVRGARAMLEEGLFTKFPRPDLCLALHCIPSLPAGAVGLTSGYTLANVDSVDIVVRGVSGHGAAPHTTKDPIVLASQIVLALQTIVSRETAPTDPAVVTVGSIHGGTKYNIIPDEVRLQLTLRSYSDQVRTHTLEAIKRIVRGLAEAAGVPENLYPTVMVADESCPATYNDPELSGRLLETLTQWLGADHARSIPKEMGAEDFSLFGRTDPPVPICMFRLGVMDPRILDGYLKAGQAPPSLHSSKFLPVTEPTLKTGVISMSAAVLELMNRPLVPANPSR